MRTIIIILNDKLIHSKNDIKRRIEPHDTLEVIHLELDLEFIACCTLHDGDGVILHLLLNCLCTCTAHSMSYL